MIYSISYTSCNERFISNQVIKMDNKCSKVIVNLEDLCDKDKDCWYMIYNKLLIN